MVDCLREGMYKIFILHAYLTTTNNAYGKENCPIIDFLADLEHVQHFRVVEDNFSILVVDQVAYQGHKYIHHKKSVNSLQTAILLIYTI